MKARTLLLGAAWLALTACNGATDSGSATGTSGSPPQATAPTASVPAVVGKRLDDAVSALAAADFVGIKPVDATGQDRAVLNPENWVVRAQDPAPGTRTRTDATITLHVAKPTDPSPGRTVPAGVVPNVVCRDLQTAQDTLQAAGFNNLGSEDGSGQGRAQVIDRNWVVIRQSAPSGSRPNPDTKIVLTAVKYGEPTGAAGCPS